MQLEYQRQPSVKLTLKAAQAEACNYNITNEGSWPMVISIGRGGTYITSINGKSKADFTDCDSYNKWIELITSGKIQFSRTYFQETNEYEIPLSAAYFRLFKSGLYRESVI